MHLSSCTSAKTEIYNITVSVIVMKHICLILRDVLDVICKEYMILRNHYREEAEQDKTGP